MRPPLAGPSQTASVCSVSPRKFSWREHGRLVRSAFALWRGHASRETSRNGLRLAARGVRRAQLHAMAQDTSEYVMREDRLGPGVTATVFRRRGRVDVEVDLSAPRPGAVAHWGVNDWNRPDESVWPPNTWDVGSLGAVESQLREGRLFRVSFPDGAVPSRLVMVFRDGNGRWDNNSDQGYSVRIPSLEGEGGAADVAGDASEGYRVPEDGSPELISTQRPPSREDQLRQDVVEAEARGDMNLQERYEAMCQVLVSLADDPDGPAFLFAWALLSAEGALPGSWAPYDILDLTETQRALSDTITAAYASAEDELSRRLLRAAAIMVPRGLGDADAVRGSVRLAAQELGLGSDRFLERWGRKMDERGDFRDMAICEAYLAFLWSDGDVDAFHKVLWEAGGLTPDDLERLTPAIVDAPPNVPALRMPMEALLWNLRCIHAVCDLDVALEAALPRLPAGVAGALQELQAARGEWWVPGRAVEIREHMQELLASGDADILMLDAALERIFCQGVEVADLDQLGSSDGLVSSADLAVRSAALSLESEEMRLIRDMWDGVCSAEEWWSQEWSNLMVRVVEQTMRTLADVIDEVSLGIEREGQLFIREGAANTDVARDALRAFPCVTACARLLHALTPSVRSAAGLPVWDVVAWSRDKAPARGVMVEARSLSDITARAPCVAIVDVVDPREPLPECVVAVLSRTPVALTARAATQARRKRITMAYGDAVADLVGGYVAEVAVGAEGVELTVLGESEDELWDGSLGEEDGRLGGEGGSEGEGRGDESTDKEAAEAAKAEEMRMAIQRDWDMFVEGAGLRAHAGVSGNGAGGNGDAGGHHALGVGAEGREMAGSHPGMNGAGAWGARSPGSGPTEDLSQAPALRALLTLVRKHGFSVDSPEGLESTIEELVEEGTCAARMAPGTERASGRTSPRTRGALSEMVDALLSERLESMREGRAARRGSPESTRRAPGNIH